MTQQIDYNDHENQFDDVNTSNNPEFSDLINARISRRSVIKGAAGVSVASFLGMSMTGCSESDDDFSPSARPSKLSFKPVAHGKEDIVKVPAGYKAEVILPMGTPIAAGIADWSDSVDRTPDSFKLRMGDNHDGMAFFGKSGKRYSANSSDNGIICINHEYTNRQYLNANGDATTSSAADKGTIFAKRRKADDVRRGVNSHGVAVVELKRKANGNGFEMVQGGFNRRITSATPATLKGPAAGSDYFKTPYDTTGNSTRGINNQCGAGQSPWGTFITTEENFRGVFARGNDANKLSAKENAGRARYGLKEGFDTWGYRWHTPNDKAEAEAGEFSRWDATANGKDATQDYRNAINTFGFIVEIDPFNPNSAPVKRTAMGRIAHENCAYAPVEEGKPVVFYMGDDSRGEYIYKYVSDAKWSKSDIGGGIAAGDKYLNKGTLYVAVFNEDGTGEWRELALGKNGIDANNKAFSFSSQDEVFIFTRLAADAAGATKMDRPEWFSVNPITKEVYGTLTNNKYRGGKQKLNAANPRAYEARGKFRGNDNGHIIRWKEEGDNHAATNFRWDIYLMGAPEALAAENLSKLNANNDFSSPDGLWFDNRGVLWIQTDDGAYTDTTNCMLLAALPGKVADGGVSTTSAGQKTHLGAVATESTVLRFLTGPKQCEITGITMTTDNKTLFVNVQHPGEKGKRTDITSSWPATQSNASATSIPRSATVVITREDGGTILG